jgi:predicted proteasome-type protease
VGRFVTIQDDDAYFNNIRHRWGALLKDAFHSLPELNWDSMQIERSAPILERLIRSTDQ